MADNSMASEERLRRLIGMVELLRRLKAKLWKRLQSLAYAFYVLVFAHLLLMLEPSAAGAWLCKKTSWCTRWCSAAIHCPHMARRMRPPRAYRFGFHRADQSFKN